MATSSQDAVSFGRNFIATISSFLQQMDDLNRAYDRMQKDPNLAASAAAALAQAGRPGLTGTDFTNAGNAVYQVQFTLESGAPTQISYLYALL